MGNITRVILNKDNSLSLETTENITNSPIGIKVAETTMVHLDRE